MFNITASLSVLIIACHAILKAGRLLRLGHSHDKYLICLHKNIRIVELRVQRSAPN